jgi:tetratricopeptide (TPR) repeat protein
MAQQGDLDSLLQSLKTKTKADTFRVNTLINIARAHLVKGKPADAIEYGKQALDLSLQLEFQGGLSSSYQMLAYAYDHTSDYPKAIEAYEKAYEISVKTGNKKDAAFIRNNLATIYIYQTNYPKALEELVKSLQISEECGDKEGIARAYINMGIIYRNQKQNRKAEEYYLKGKKVCEEIGMKRGLGFVNSNLAVIYEEDGNYDKAIEAYEKALEIHEESGNLEMIATISTNIGDLYVKMQQYPKAAEFLQKGLRQREESGDKKGIADSRLKVGMLESALGNSAAAIGHYRASITISEEIKTPELLRYGHKQLAEELYKTGKYKEAYDHYTKFHEITDSIFNEENSRVISDIKTNFEVQKKETELKARAEAQEAIAAEEKKRQRLLLYSVAGILFIVLIFSFFLFKRFQVTRRQKKIIEQKSLETEAQKNLVEEKQREIIDSITYAKRLQQAILPPDPELKKYLPHSFLVYDPKDIVAGDFYWLHTNETDIYIAAADCTGHGVPGAMVSVVCSNALNRSVNEFAMRETGEILDKTRELVIATFEKSGENVKDGMDISLLRIKKGSTAIQWSGANNPLWYVCNGVISEIKGDKQPVGKSDHNLRFKSHDLTLQKDNMLYLFTDGFADQFGGTKGKKFKSTQLKSLLLRVSSMEVDEQKTIIRDEYMRWKGELEQIDDICIIGIRL